MTTSTEIVVWRSYRNLECDLAKLWEFFFCMVGKKDALSFDVNWPIRLPEFLNLGTWLCYETICCSTQNWTKWICLPFKGFILRESRELCWVNFFFLLIEMTLVTEQNSLHCFNYFWCRNEWFSYQYSPTFINDVHFWNVNSC